MSRIHQANVGLRLKRPSNISCGYQCQQVVPGCCPCGHVQPPWLLYLLRNLVPNGPHLHPQVDCQGICLETTPNEYVNPKNSIYLTHPPSLALHVHRPDLYHAPLLLAGRPKTPTNVLPPWNTCPYQDPCVQLHTSYLCPVIAKLQTDADNKSKDLHEKTASSPGQRRAGGDDKSGLVVNTESGVSGVAWTKRMNGAQACLQTNSHQLRRYRRLCRSGRFHMPPPVP